MTIPIEHILVVIGTLVGAVAMLFRRLQASQEARVREAHEHERSLQELKALIERRKNGGGS